MDLRITIAEETDISAIAELLSEATAYKVQHGDLAWGEAAWTTNEVALEMARYPFYIARQDGNLVGACMLGSDDAAWGESAADGLYVYHLAVKSGLHVQNLGGLLLNWAGQEAGQQGRVYLRLDCRADNQKLRSYYEAQSFRLVKTQKHPTEDYVAAYYQRPVLYENNTMNK